MIFVCLLCFLWFLSLRVLRVSAVRHLPKPLPEGRRDLDDEPVHVAADFVQRPELVAWITQRWPPKKVVSCRWATSQR